MVSLNGSNDASRDGRCKLIVDASKARLHDPGQTIHASARFSYTCRLASIDHSVQPQVRTGKTLRSRHGVCGRSFRIHLIKSAFHP